MTFLLFTGLLFAAPAFERTRTFTQPDGSTFTGTLKGDEYLHWIETETGEIVAFNKTRGQYETVRIGLKAFEFSGHMYHPDEHTFKAAARTVKDRNEALRKLWLEKRKAEMERRKADR